MRHALTRILTAALIELGHPHPWESLSGGDAARVYHERYMMRVTWWTRRWRHRLRGDLELARHCRRTRWRNEEMP